MSPPQDKPSGATDSVRGTRAIPKDQTVGQTFEFKDANGNIQKEARIAKTIYLPSSRLTAGKCATRILSQSQAIHNGEAGHHNAAVLAVARLFPGWDPTAKFDKEAPRTIPTKGMMVKTICDFMRESGLAPAIRSKSLEALIKGEAIKEVTEKGDGTAYTYDPESRTPLYRSLYDADQRAMNKKKTSGTSKPTTPKKVSAAANASAPASATKRQAPETEGDGRKSKVNKGLTAEFDATRDDKKGDDKEGSKGKTAEEVEREKKIANLKAKLSGAKGVVAKPPAPPVPKPLDCASLSLPPGTKRTMTVEELEEHVLVYVADLKTQKNILEAMPEAIRPKKSDLAGKKGDAKVKALTMLYLEYVFKTVLHRSAPAWEDDGEVVSISSSSPDVIEIAYSDASAVLVDSDSQAEGGGDSEDEEEEEHAEQNADGRKWCHQSVALTSVALDAAFDNVAGALAESRAVSRAISLETLPMLPPCACWYDYHPDVAVQCNTCGDLRLWDECRKALTPAQWLTAVKAYNANIENERALERVDHDMYGSPARPTTSSVAKTGPQTAPQQRKTYGKPRGRKESVSPANVGARRASTGTAKTATGKTAKRGGKGNGAQ